MRMKLLAAATAVLSITGPALAADLPSRGAPPLYVPPPPVLTWTGCHVGGNFGYGWQKNHAYDPNVSADAGTDTGSGLVGGGQLGCDYQVGSFVLGVQGMFDGAEVRGSHIDPPPSGTSPSDVLGFNTRWLATETGRIGYAVLPQALVYFKGGAAEARLGYSEVDPTIPFSGAASVTRIGWTIGGGVEYAITSNWSIFAEYDYVDFGSHNTTLTYTPTVFLYSYKETQNLQTVLVGVNYKFGWDAPPAPVVAKY
jgi:outer membrane immunogenic protein